MYVCPECGDDTLESQAAVDECSLLDAVEARQIRAAEKKRKPWDSGIIRGYD